MKELTARQQQILRFIQGKQDSDGLTPTFREIATHFRFNSPNAALTHVQALRDKGFLKNLPGRARSSLPQHRAILLAIRGHQPRRAGAAMRRLVETTADSIETLSRKRSARR